MAAGTGRVVVIGGGISGLATAWYLQREHPGLAVEVHEASDRLGGKVHTTTLAGTAFDVGADSFLFRQPEFTDLCRDLGLDGELVAPATGQVWLWGDEGLLPLPASGTVLGIPVDMDAVEASGVLSERGMSRARGEAHLPPPELGPDDDPPVAEFVAQRYGLEVVERLVDPLLSGIYAGSTARLGLRSAAPAIAKLVDDAAARRTSITQTAIWRRELALPDDRPVFATVRGGLSRVVKRLASDLDVRLESPVERLALQSGRWHVDGEPADAVVLATPAWAASRIVASGAPKLASLLDRIDHAGATVVAMALPGDVQLPEGSGMLVPRGGGRRVKAVTWSSRKWPHLAGGPNVLLRASLGRIDDRRHEALSDLDVLEATVLELGEALDVELVPEHAVVQRWPRGLPQYDSGHLARVGEIRAAAHEAGLVLTGAAYDGVGLPACVRQARAAAEQVGSLVAA